MAREINLLPQRKLGVLQKEKTLFIVRIVAGIWVLITIASIAIFSYLDANYSLASLQAQQQASTQKLSLLNTKISQYLTVVDRTRHIEKIISGRLSLVDKISLIQQQVPGDVTSTSFQIDMKSMTMTASSPSLSSLQKLIASFSSLLQQKKVFQTLTINAITADQKTGTYSVDIQATLL